MIELYQIFVGKYDNDTTEWITGKGTKTGYQIMKNNKKS